MERSAKVVVTIGGPVGAGAPVGAGVLVVVMIVGDPSGPVDVTTIVVGVGDWAGG